METVFSVGSAPKLYNEDPRPAQIELMEPFEVAVEDGWEETVRKELGCARETSCVLQLQ
jgi:hypothetical protein